MGISLVKEEGQEIVHHRTLLGNCWNGREEVEEEARYQAEWAYRRQKTEEAFKKRVASNTYDGDPSHAPKIELPRTAPRALYPSTWMAVSDSTIALQTKRVCFTLPAFDERQRKVRKKAKTGGGSGVPTRSFSGVEAVRSPTLAGAGRSLRSAHNNNTLLRHPFPSPSAETRDINVAVMPDVSFTTSFTQALIGDLRQRRVRRGSWGTFPGTAPTDMGVSATGLNDRVRTNSGLVLKHMKNSDNFRHFVVEVFNRHSYLLKYRMGVLKDVYFAVAPARRRYDHALLKGFPFYFPPPEGDGETALPLFLDESAESTTALPTPQPLDPRSLTASLLVASYGFDATQHRQRMSSLFAPGRPMSYPLVDRDSPHVMSTQTPVVIYSISALELLLMPKEAEICFGCWCHISLEDERRRLILALELLVSRLEEEARYRLPPELAGDNAMEALHVPWATHLTDYLQRQEDLKEKLYYRQRLKELHIKPKKAAAGRRRISFPSGLPGRNDEMWFPFAFLVVAIPQYACGIHPTAFHQHTTRSNPVSLHLRHSLSRSMFGVGCITAIRYGGLLVQEHRGKVDRDDLKWLRHFLKLVQHELPSSSSSIPVTPHPNAVRTDQKPDEGEEELRTAGSATFQGARSVMFPQQTVPIRRSLSALGGANPATYSEDEECLQSFRKAFQPALELLCLTKRRVQRRLRRRRLAVAMAHTRLSARLLRVEKHQALKQRGSFFGLKGILHNSSSKKGSAATRRHTNQRSDEDSLLDFPIEDVSSVGSSSSSSSSTSSEREAAGSFSELHPSMDVALRNNDHSNLVEGGREENPTTGGMHRLERSVSNLNRPSAPHKQANQKTLIRGAVRQVGGVQCLDVNVALRTGVSVHTVESAVATWVDNLMLAPIRARPLAIYLQRYEGISESIRVGATEIVYHHVPNEDLQSAQGGSFRGSFFGMQPVSTASTATGPLLNGLEGPISPRGMGSFRLGAAGLGVGGANTDNSLRDEFEHGMSGIVGGAATAAEAIQAWHGSSRGLPFVTTYSGALDPEIAPRMTPALEHMLQLYHLFDPDTSDCLMTELRALHDQRNMPYHRDGPGVDREWLEADRVVRNLKAELEEVEDLLHQSQSEMLDRLQEYHRLADLFLPHTKMDHVTSHMVYMKMMRQSADNIPIKEVTYDWMNTLLGVLTIPYEEMFFVGKLQPPETECVFRRYASYMPSPMTPNSYIDVCEANRPQLAFGGGMEVSTSTLMDGLSAHRRMVEYKMVDLPAVIATAAGTKGGAVTASPLSSATWRSRSNPSKGLDAGPTPLPPLSAPKSVSEVILAPVPIPLALEEGSGDGEDGDGVRGFPRFASHPHSTDYLPRTHLLTGGSMGLLAGVLTFYADYLRRRAAKRITSFEEWVASGEEVFLRRLVVWGARGGGRSHGSGWDCCGDGGEDQVVRDKRPPPVVSAAVAGASPSPLHMPSRDDFPSSQPGRRTSQMRGGYESMEELSPSSPLGPSANGSATTASLTTRGERSRASPESLTNHWKGAAFTTVEMFALFDAVEYYLTTLRELRQQYSSQSNFPVRKPQKSKSWLQRLFDRKSSEKKPTASRGSSAPSGMLRRGWNTNMNNNHRRSSLETPNNSSVRLDQTFHSREPFASERLHGSPEPAAPPSLPRTLPYTGPPQRKAPDIPAFTSFELCVASNYYYHELHQIKAAWHHRNSEEEDDYHHSGDDAAGAQPHQTTSGRPRHTGSSYSHFRRDDVLVSHEREDNYGSPPSDSPRRSGRAAALHGREAVYFHVGNAATPKEWKKRAEVERPYTGAEEEAEELRRRHQRYMKYQTESLHAGMEKALSHWKNLKKASAHRESRGAQPPSVWEEEELERMIRIRLL